jgi:hypothetical protein
LGAARSAGLSNHAAVDQGLCLYFSEAEFCQQLARVLTE